MLRENLLHGYLQCMHNTRRLRAKELAHCAKSLGIEVLGVQEHRQVHQAQFVNSIIEDCFLVTSSTWRNEGQAGVGGVQRSPTKQLGKESGM